MFVSVGCLLIFFACFCCFLFYLFVFVDYVAVHVTERKETIVRVRVSERDGGDVRGSCRRGMEGRERDGRKSRERIE